MIESITLCDDASGSTAVIAPELGFNCYRFTAAPAGKPVEVLWSDPRFAEGNQRPTRSGIPILFPFAGRIRGTSYVFEGRTYTLDRGDDFGNAIHGFVVKRPWRVTDQRADRVTAEFQPSVDDQALLERWPSDFRIGVTYRVRGHELICEIDVANAGDRRMPFTLGTHPYFRVPIGGPEAGACIVRVPVQSEWELEQLLPTGRVVPAPLGAKLRDGMRFDESKFDDVFSGLEAKSGKVAASVHDPASGRTMTLTFDDTFAQCVVFNPPHREAICIEPYTAAPNAFELESRGIHTGMRVLEPAEIALYSFVIGVE